MLKFITISDTHGKHQQLQLPQGDVLIHAGDVTSRGRKAEVIDFIKWFSEQDFEFKFLLQVIMIFILKRQQLVILKALFLLLFFI
jgi:3',5'-cyclic AMP phosphodiesterase CpdA